MESSTGWALHDCGQGSISVSSARRIRSGDCAGTPENAGCRTTFWAIWCNYGAIWRGFLQAWRGGAARAPEPVRQCQYSGRIRPDPAKNRALTAGRASGPCEAGCEPRVAEHNCHRDFFMIDKTAEASSHVLRDSPAYASPRVANRTLPNPTLAERRLRSGGGAFRVGRGP